jgi:hypothetical protein
MSVNDLNKGIFNFDLDETEKMPEFKITVKQHNALNFIEDVLPVQFLGTTKQEATAFIGEHLEQAVEQYEACKEEEREEKYGRWCGVPSLMELRKRFNL